MGTTPLTPRPLYSFGDVSVARQLKQANRPHYQGLTCSLLFLTMVLLHFKEIIYLALLGHPQKY